MDNNENHFDIGEYDFEYVRLIGSPHLVLSDFENKMGADGQLSLGALRALEIPKIDINDKNQSEYDSVKVVRKAFARFELTGKKMEKTDANLIYDKYDHVVDRKFADDFFAKAKSVQNYRRGFVDRRLKPNGDIEYLDSRFELKRRLKELEEHMELCGELAAETQDMKEIRYFMCFGQFFKHMDSGFYKKMKDLQKDPFIEKKEGDELAVYYRQSSFFLNQIIMKYRNRDQSFDQFDFVDAEISKTMGYDLNNREDRVKHWKNAFTVLQSRLEKEYVKTFGENFKEEKFNLSKLAELYALILEKIDQVDHLWNAIHPYYVAPIDEVQEEIEAQRVEVQKKKERAKKQAAVKKQKRKKKQISFTAFSFLLSAFFFAFDVYEMFDFFTEDSQVEETSNMPTIEELEAQKAAEKAAKLEEAKSKEKDEVFDMTKINVVDKTASDFLLDSKKTIVDALNEFDLPEGVASEIFREAVGLTKRLCPKGADRCGSFTIVPSDKKYLQTGKITKIGAIQIDLDKQTVEIPIRRRN